MVHKQISIYSSSETHSPFNSDQLIVEIAHAYMVFMVIASSSKNMIAFELFEFESSQTNWYDIFQQVKRESVILDKTYLDTQVYYNFSEAVVIPVSAFTTEAADAYLAAIHGDNTNNVIRYDNVNVADGMVTVYRIRKTLNDILNSHLMMVTPRHLYSKVLETVLNHSSEAKQSFAPYINLQFYSKEMIVLLMQHGKLQLIQSYAFQTADDVLYHLLNIANQFQLSVNDTRVNLSGLIDPKSHHLEYITKIFNHISYSDQPTSTLFQNGKTGFPSYYFTPFVNLSL